MESHKLVVVYLKDSSVAESIRRAIEQSEIEVRSVDRVEDFFDLANSRAISVVLLQENLGGLFSGTEVIERTFQGVLRPPVLLLTSGVTRLQADPSSPFDAVLPLDADPREIAAAVTRLLSTPSDFSLTIPAIARQIVKRQSDIPAMPQVLVWLAQAGLRTDVTNKEVSDKIALDPTLTMDLLRLTNASSNGISQRVTRVLDAVGLLGIRKTSSMLLANRICRANMRKVQGVTEGERTWFAQRSVFLASAASVFGDRFEALSADTCYLLGLLQDIGIMIMLQDDSLGYQYVLKRFRTIGPLRLELLEREAYGVTHADVSAALLAQWGFTSSIVAPIATHHADEPEDGAPVSSVQTVLSCAESLANLVDGHTPHRLPVLSRQMTRLRWATTQRTKQAISEIVANVMESSALFSTPAVKASCLEAAFRQVVATEVGSR